MDARSLSKPSPTSGSASRSSSGLLAVGSGPLSSGEFPISVSDQRRLGEGDRETDEDLRIVADWLLAFTKAMRAARVYAENNQMYQTFVDRAFDGLGWLFQTRGELSFAIREDRVLYEREVVHVDSDRQEGLPFLLYRNAFRRLTFVPGMTRDELVELIGALNADYGALDLAGEDLVSTLWRLRLPHLRYVTIDALSVDSRARLDDDLADADVDQIQADIESIVAAIYQSAISDDDAVKGVSIGRDDLEALAELQSEPREDLDLLDHATERAIADVPSGQLLAVKAFLEGDDRDALTRRMVDILVRILVKEDSSAASGATIELLQQLYESLLLSQRYGDARELVERLQASVDQQDNLQERHIAQHLLRMFSTEGRLLPVLDALNDGHRTAPLSELLAFLRSLGPGVSPALVAGLGNLDSAAHRKLICDLVAELGVPDVHVLESRSADAKWFVVRDLLELARHHPLERITRLVKDALRHEHPKVRAQAVRVLRGYGPGLADEMVGDRLRDEDPEVRMVAARVAASRRSKSLLPAFEAMIKEDDLPDRDPRELKVLLGAYATVGQGSSARVLGQLLQPSFFSRLKQVDLQVAAASALGLIPSDTARAYLKKGARSLNPKVRDASKRALAQTHRTLDTGDGAEARGPPAGPDLGAPLDSSGDERTIPAGGNSADVLFTVSGDLGPSSSSDLHPAIRSGPSISVVDRPHGGREAMPMNLPPAPGTPELDDPSSPPAPDGGGQSAGLPVESAPGGRRGELGPSGWSRDLGSGSVDLVPEVFDFLGRMPPSELVADESYESGIGEIEVVHPESEAEPPPALDPAHLAPVDLDGASVEADLDPAPAGPPSESLALLAADLSGIDVGGGALSTETEPSSIDRLEAPPPLDPSALEPLDDPGPELAALDPHLLDLDLEDSPGPEEEAEQDHRSPLARPDVLAFDDETDALFLEPRRTVDPGEEPEEPEAGLDAHSQADPLDQAAHAALTPPPRMRREHHHDDESSETVSELTADLFLDDSPSGGGDR